MVSYEDRQRDSISDIALDPESLTFKTQRKISMNASHLCSLTFLPTLRSLTFKNPAQNP
jgi:hypothetical protein